MRDRLTRLSGQAHALKGSVPHEIEASLDRVETGADALASRIEAHEARRHTHAEPPPALRSAVPADALRTYDRGHDGHAWGQPAAMDPDLEPWDLQSADALSRAYEANDMLVPVTPASPKEAAKAAVPSQPEPAMFASNQHPSRSQDAAAEAMFAAASASSMPQQSDEDHRRWLEDKLSDVAARVEQSLMQFQPGHSLEKLSERFEQLEARWTRALTDVATRSDVEGLRLVEEHIAELATRIENAQEQLARLDTIEGQIAELGHKLSDEEIVRLFGSLVPSEEDLVRFAETAAMSAAERAVSDTATAFAGTGHVGGPAPSASIDTEALIPTLVEATREASSERLNSLEHLLQGYIDEGRKGSSETAEALETIQHALQHMLDRLETFETKQAELAEKAAQPAPTHQRPHAEHVVAAPEAHSSSSPVGGVSAGTHDDLNVAAVRAAARAAAAGAANRRQAPVGASARPPAAAVLDDSDDELIVAPRGAGPASAARGRPPQRPQAGLAGEKSAPASKSPGLRERFFGGGDKNSSRAGLLLVPSFLALMVAGYYLVISPKKRAAQSAAVRVERVAPPSSKPTSNSPAIDQKMDPKPTNDAPGAPNKQSMIEGNGDSNQSADARDALDAAEAASRVRLASAGIAIQHDQRDLTEEELLRARERVHIAQLSGQAAQNAAASSEQLGSPPSEVVEDMHRIAAGSADLPPKDANSETTTVELPPATIGPLSLRLAAAKGDRSAQFEVAARFAEGKGVKQDFAEAANWYQRAAAQGVPVAQYRLAALYERGLGVKADAARARIWYKRAAEQGNVKAMHNLAVLSASRSNGDADYPTAAQWFSEAADRGLADSQYNLGVLYESGLGVPKNLVSAYKWYSIAAQRGDKEAARRRDQLRSRLDARSLAQAEKAMKAWQPRVIDRNANDALAAGDSWKQRVAQSATHR